MEKNLIAIDRTQTDELIETLSFLQLQVLATLKNDRGDGLIKDLKKLNNETTVIKNEISKSQSNITNNLAILQKILKKIEVNESSSEVRVMNFNEYFQNEIEKLKNEVLENINKTVENLNEKIEERISNIDIKSIERASNNSLTAINRLNTFYTTSKGINDNIQSKLKLTSLFLSFIGGATLASLLFYFIF
jgi:hypothetical protein